MAVAVEPFHTKSCQKYFENHHFMRKPHLRVAGSQFHLKLQLIQGELGPWSDPREQLESWMVTLWTLWTIKLYSILIYSCLQLVLIWFLFPLHLKKVVCNQCNQSNQSNHHLCENCTPSNPQGPGKGTVVSRWLQSTRKTNAFRTSHRVPTSSGHEMNGTDLPPSHKTLSMIRMHVYNMYIYIYHICIYTHIHIICT